MQPSEAHMEILTGFLLKHGALFRSPNDTTLFVDEPLDFFKSKHKHGYYMLPQAHFADIFKIGKDSATVIASKMTKVFNDFFSSPNISGVERKIMIEARSQKQITENSHGNIKLIPHVGMVKVYIILYVGM